MSITPSIDLIKKFTDENAGLIISYFIINILTLALETIVLSILLSKIFSAFNQKSDVVKKLLISYVVIFIIIRIGYYLRKITYNELIPKFYYYLRVELYNKIIDRYKIDYKELNTGYILYNFEHLPSSFKILVTELLQTYIPNIIAIFVCVCYLFYTSKLVGTIVLLGVCTFIIIVVLSINKSIDLNTEEHIAFKHNNEHINDRINNLFDIYTSGTENIEKQEYADSENHLKQSMFENFKYITMITSIVEIFTILILGSSLYILYTSYKNKTISNEHIISTILVLTYFVIYFSKMANNYIGMTDVFGYSKESDRFIKEINGKDKGNESSSNEILGNLDNNLDNNGIEFKGVNFSYPNYDNSSESKRVLNKANIYIKQGSKIAIYGKSGSGKSTLIKLLLGFYNLESGSILINGTDIKTITVDELRKNISVVNQNIKLFDKTIYENMIYGHECSDSNECLDMVKNLLKDINIFGGVSDGLNTQVGVAGSKLSGGQKQIINFIRAILKNAPILVLDEPTSALDQVTKTAFINIIKKIKNKTVIIITHDNSLKNCVDKSYKLMNGKLILI